MLVQRSTVIVQVVRAYDRGVARGVAAADPALLEHRDVAQAVFARQVVRGAQPMATAADDDGLVFGLELGRAPLRGPATLAAQPLEQQCQCRKFPHSSPTICEWYLPGLCATPMTRSTPFALPSPTP